MSHAPPPSPTSQALRAAKTVLVTASAGTGIGVAAARRCAEEGATVMLSDIHERRLADSAERLAKITGGSVPHQVCDVTSEEQVRIEF
jgi:3-oxoacyl-[acyl-carrier protein] reductase